MTSLSKVDPNATRFQFRVVNPKKKVIRGVRLYFCGRFVNAPKGIVNTAFVLDDRALDAGCEVQVYRKGRRLDHGGFKIYPSPKELIRETIMVDAD